MSRFITSLLLGAVVLCATSAIAGPLTTDSAAYFDGFVTWQGTTPYQGYNDYPTNSSPSGLYGTIDWAVYAPGDFPAGYLGYTPTPGEFVYAYQAYVDGPAPLSGHSLTLEAIADNIGSFAGLGVVGQAPSAAYFFPNPLTPTSANWDFNPTIPTGASSNGLVFSSPFGPKLSSGSVIDDGSVGDVIPLPSPDPAYVPEPGTLTLAACGLVAFGLHWLRRRGRRVV